LRTKFEFLAVFAKKKMSRSHRSDYKVMCFQAGFV